MKTIRVLVVSVFAFTSALMLGADTYYWKGPSSYADYADPANWIKGTSPSGPAATEVPGAGDKLHYTIGYDTYQRFDFGGGNYSVLGVDYTGSGTLQYGHRYMGFKNGSFTFTEDVYARRVYAVVEDGGSLTFGENCNVRFGWSGAENQIEVKSGGELNVRGSVSIGSLRILNSAGGTVVFDPASLVLWEESGSNVYSSFDNSGDMSFPGGLHFTESAARKASHANETRFVQSAGTMTFDGPVNVETVEFGTFTFKLAGGRLVVNDDVSMAGFDSVGMSAAGTAAEIYIAEGKTLDWSTARFAADTTLTVTGGGTLVLGAFRPTTLNLAPGVSLSSRVLLVGAGLRVDEIVGWENSDFEVSIDFENLPPSPIFSSSNRGILEKYFGAIEAPPGWQLAIEGDSVVVVSRPSADFAWQGGVNLEKFTSPSMWSIGRTEGLFYNPYSVLPGPRDAVFYGIGSVHRKFYFDMDGVSHTVGRFVGEQANWNEHDIIVTNGTLVFAESFSNAFIKADILAGGQLVLAESSRSLVGKGGAINSFNIRAGGELDIFGALEMNGLKISNHEGGCVVFTPREASLYYDNHEGVGRTGRGVFNSGLLVLTNGLDLGISGGAPINQFRESPSVFTLEHNSGELVLGGRFCATPYGETLPKLRFRVNGGSVEVVGDTSFDVSMDEASLAGGSETAWTIAAGKTLDLTGLDIAADASMTVSCPSSGKVVFGRTLPGSLSLEGAVTLAFAVPGLRLDAVSGYGSVKAEIPDAMLQDGMCVIASADAGFVAKIAESAELPAGWRADVVGDAVVLKNTAFVVDRPMFESAGERSLSSADGWSGPALTAGASVYVSGGETVAVMDGNLPDIAKITVRDGATLKISGQMADMPELEVLLDGKIVVAPGAEVTLPRIAATASSDQLPVVEISTGAVVKVESDYEFKNVRLDLFGELRHLSNVRFGTADAGEIAYFEMRAIGGIFNDYTQANGTNSFVSPRAKGGRVISPGGVLLKDVRYLPLYNGRVSHNVGDLNPVNEPFTMTIDGCYLDLRGNRLMNFGGAATVRCINGGGLYKHDAWCSWGLYAKLNFKERARLILEDGSVFYFVYNQVHFVEFAPEEAGSEQLVLRNGSAFAVHAADGKGISAVRVEDSYFDVMQLQVHTYKDANGVDRSDPRSDWYWEAFKGFTEIHVPEGRFFGMRASDRYSHGADWNRTLAIGAPVTGGGDLIVTNSTPGLTLAAIVKSGANTATGRAKVAADTPGSLLVFADGSNWAGTLAADGNVAFTNLTAAAAPASVSLGAMELSGSLPLRVWGGEAPTNDFLAVSGNVAVIGGGRVAPRCMDGYKPRFGDVFRFARVPASTPAVPLARGWKLVEEELSDGFKLLSARWDPDGMVITVR